MGTNTVLIGTCVIAVSSLYLFIKLRDSIETRQSNNQKAALAGNYAELKDDPFTPFFMLLSFGVFLFSIFLIGSLAYDDYNYCTILPVNISIVNSSLTTMDYNRVCFTNSNTGANMLFGLSNFWIYVTVILFSAMSIYFIFQFVRDRVYGRYNNGKKK